MTQINEKVQKLFNIDIKSIDEEKRQVTFCFSDDSIDRMGEKVDQASWDVKSYKQNPVFLWGHNPGEPENVLGQGISLSLNQQGKGNVRESYITAQFDEDEINPKAGLTFRQVVKRTLRAVSAGFIPHTIEWEDDVPVLKDNELLEVSLVAIPANRNAIALSYKAGEISKKDAQWLIKSMHEEIELIEKQMAADKDIEMETKDVEELKAQISTLTDLVSNMGSDLADAKAEITKLSEARQDDDSANSGDDSTNSSGDGQSGSDDAQDDKDGSANDGDNDQSGAADEIDLDAELTPELEAQIEAELAEVA